MKAFAMLTTVVLVVIAVGVGLVGGLPTTDHSLGGAHFSIAFAGNYGHGRQRQKD